MLRNCWVFFLFLAVNVFAGVPIEISPADYEKFLLDVDVATKRLPSEWENYRIQENQLKLPSGVVLPVSEIKKIAGFDPEQLLQFIETKDIHVRVVCSARKNYEKTIVGRKCESLKSFPLELDLEKHNALYVSKYSTMFPNEKRAVLVVRQDAPRYTILHEYIHFLQEHQVRPYLRDLTFKSLRVALGDTLYARGEKRNGVENLAFQELRLLQSLGDEVENYASMLKYHRLFELGVHDAHDLLWKIQFYLSQCQSKQCANQMAKAKDFYSQLEIQSMKERFKGEYAIDIGRDVIAAALKKIKTYSSYGEWFEMLKQELYTKNHLLNERAEGRDLFKRINDSKFPYKDKEKAFKKLFDWMAKNSLIQYHALKIVMDLQKENPKWRHFQSQIAADFDAFSKVIQ